MKIILPVTYRLQFFAFMNLVFLFLMLIYFFEQEWLVSIYFGAIEVFILLLWRICRITITVQGITYHNFGGAKRMKWHKIKQIGLMHRIFGRYYLTLIGDRKEEFLIIPSSFLTIDKLREVIAIIETEAPDALIDPMIPKFFDRRFL